ncbi:hypothetical protein [Halomonas kalidii]|uniref:hypothetical protein n=1 Tax=Halomonas kalidii TaxID=3043293 RepID=UPI0024A97E42|nr:hypothetical protein [Halomonas kalidii]
MSKAIKSASANDADTFDSHGLILEMVAAEGFAEQGRQAAGPTIIWSSDLSEDGAGLVSLHLSLKGFQRLLLMNRVVVLTY